MLWVAVAKHEEGPTQGRTFIADSHGGNYSMSRQGFGQRRYGWVLACHRDQ